MKRFLFQFSSLIEAHGPWSILYLVALTTSVIMALGCLTLPRLEPRIRRTVVAGFTTSTALLVVAAIVCVERSRAVALPVIVGAIHPSQEQAAVVARALHSEVSVLAHALLASHLLVPVIGWLIIYHVPVRYRSELAWASLTVAALAYGIVCWNLWPFFDALLGWHGELELDPSLLDDRLAKAKLSIETSRLLLNGLALLGVPLLTYLAVRAARRGLVGTPRAVVASWCAFALAFALHRTTVAKGNDAVRQRPDKLTQFFYPGHPSVHGSECETRRAVWPSPDNVIVVSVSADGKFWSEGVSPSVWERIGFSAEHAQEYPAYELLNIASLSSRVAAQHRAEEFRLDNWIFVIHPDTVLGQARPLLEAISHLVRNAPAARWPVPPHYYAGGWQEKRMLSESLGWQSYLDTCLTPLALDDILAAPDSALWRELVK